MLGFLNNKKNKGTSLVLKIDGMHCASCSMNIDGELEELEGVLDSSTSYAKQETKVSYDQSKIDPAKIRKVIEGLGYKVV